MKQLVRGALIALSITFIAGLVFYYSDRYSVLTSDPTDAVSGDAVVVLEFKGGHDLYNRLSRSSVWKNLLIDPSLAGGVDDLKRLDSVFSINEVSADLWRSATCILSWHPDGNRSGAWLLSTYLPQGTNSNSAVRTMETIAGPTDWATREFEDVKIHESGQGRGLCFFVSNGIFACSRSAVVLENSIRHLRNGVPLRKQEQFSSVRKKPEAAGDLRIYIDLPALKEYWSGRLTDKGRRFANMIAGTGSWMGGELSLESTGISLEGPVSTGEGTELLQVLGPGSSEGRLLKWLPDQTAWLTWFPFRQGTTWKKIRSNKAFFQVPQSHKAEIERLQKSLEKELPSQIFDSTSGEFCLFITEAVTPELENNVFIAVQLDDPAAVNRFISTLERKPMNARKDKAEPMVIECSEENITPAWFGELSRGIRRTAVAVYGNMVVFGNQSAALARMFQQGKSQPRLYSNPVFRNTVVGAGKDAVLISFASARRSEQLLHAIFDSVSARSLTDSTAWTTRFESASAVFRKSGRSIRASLRLNLGTGALVPAALSWATRLDTTLACAPQVVQLGDHSEEVTILVQDLRNTLYFIRPSGTIRLKKPLPDRIEGTIGIIDLYGNGASQLLFTTRKQLWVVDSDGNNVGAFPLRLPSDCAGPCAFVRNANGKSERCFVPCDNGVVYGFEKDGRPLQDWQQRPSFDSLVSPILIMRDSSGIRLLIHDKNGLRLLSRNGKPVRLPSDIEISTITGIHLDSGRTCLAFARTVDGKVASIDVAGRKLDYLLSEDSVSDLNCIHSGTGELLLITTDSSGIQVRNRLGELQQLILSPFKGTSSIKGVEDPGIRFWGLLDPKGEQLAAFDMNGSLLPGFPVNGGIGFDVIRNQNDESSMGIVVTAGDGTVLLYAVQR